LARRTRLPLLLLCALALAAPGAARAAKAVQHGPITIWTVRYRAHNGAGRNAYVLLPRWYGPARHPRIPLIISPHGRGLTGLANARNWGTLPARGGFAVVSPDGQGRVLENYSWGAAGQIDDLARMPAIVERTLPWLHVDWQRIYAFGGSMGGQESLLLLARHPQLLAGAAIFDSVSDFARQYRLFPSIPCDRTCKQMWRGSLGVALQGLARTELGGSPRKDPLAWKLRSPITYVRSIAASCVPLQLWWSVADRIVQDQRQQTGLLYDQIMKLNPNAPVTEYQGFWRHSHEMTAASRLPLALVQFGLLPPDDAIRPVGLHYVAAPETPDWCRLFQHR
jgi:pimeloyl-ACP methyl ester carboxylesterase